MADPDRPTVEKSELTNAHTNPPNPGEQVWALNHGNVLVKEIWKSASIKYFDAWAYYPKVPDDVKAIQASRFKVKKEQP